MSERATIDPFGCPDVFCNDLAYVELAAPGVIRFGLYSFEGEEKILRAKILLPSLMVPAAVKRVSTFLAVQMYDRLIPERRVM